MSFPRYPKYKDSGVEWLGEVPEDWRVCAFRHCLSQIFNGLTSTQVDEAEQTVPVTRIETISAGVIDESRLGFINAYDAREDRKLRNGDILFSNINSLNMIGNCAIYAGGREIYAGMNLLVLRPAPQIEPRWLYWLIRSSEFREVVESLAKPAINQASISQSSINSISVPVPAGTEQTLITSFLDRETAKIDELVAEQRRLIELLKEKRQAVISHAVTKGLNPHAPMKPSGIDWIGDVPATWTVTKLGRAAFMQEGPGLRNWQFTDEGTRVICVTNITENGIDFSRLEKFISTDEYSSGYTHFTVQTGDVLLSSSGNSWGKVAIYDGNEKVILNTSTIRLNEAEGRPLTRDFLAILLPSDNVREQLRLAMTGSCQPNFGPSHLKSVMVPIPSCQEQSEIVTFVTNETAKFDTLTAEAQQTIELLQERRTALISAAVTGKIDVRGLAERGGR